MDELFDNLFISDKKKTQGKLIIVLETKDCY